VRPHLGASGARVGTVAPIEQQNSHTYPRLIRPIVGSC
jgi:hypothetical protein